ncbi:MAG: hypothetical protein COB79_05035 [Zetaproteobacteria bacterium]|nr:MAG: hypothetical protein COB79_05035 [Zetaproteobacteria bacterium]
MLRPAFTQHLADTLLAGKHVNLISPHGRGRRQTLLDLETLLDDVVVRKIDLKREQNKWQSWLEDTLILSVQVIVIIHNFDVYFRSTIELDLERLSQQNNLTFLCIVEHEITHNVYSVQSIILPL